jgi:hypothetical protein
MPRTTATFKNSGKVVSHDTLYSGREGGGGERRGGKDSSSKTTFLVQVHVRVETAC